MATSNNRPASSRKSAQAKKSTGATRKQTASASRPKTASASSRSKTASASSRSKTASAGRSKATSRSNGSRASRASASPARAGNSSNGSGAVQRLSHAVGTATRKARVPMIAGGATAAAVAGGALLKRQLAPKRRKVLGVSVPKPKLDSLDLKPIAKQIANAGKRVTTTSEQLSKLSGDVERVGKTAQKVGDSLS